MTLRLATRDHAPASAAPSTPPMPSMRATATAWIAGLHDATTRLLSALDGGSFREDAWVRDEGGGGTARVLTDGALFEKAGVNRSAVYGAMPPEQARRLGAAGADAATAFFVTGMSLVLHPRSPMVPTLHLNVRYFEFYRADGTVADWWFGGGTDLTPYYPHAEDVRDFHRALRNVCDRHHRGFHPRFKAWCDRYFTNTHRGGEARGVGGIFFDHLRHDDESGLSRDELLAFVGDVGHSVAEAYAPIVERRRDEAYGARERDFQLFRRGRYVEFNLVHDRGTTFGLQTNARIESVLMSLPPLAAWPYAPAWPADSFESRLLAMLAPRDWAAGA
jgi:coproporphyrinogen III oxidase